MIGEEPRRHGDVRGAEPARPLKRGQAVGRYLIIERLGAGGMGIVYAAYDPELDRKIALKLLHRPHDPKDAEANEQRLLREARALAKLSHPNVVSVHDVGTFHGRVFLAMEFIEGRTLGRHLEELRPARREIIALFLAAGRGLSAAHAVGLVHRDFKPDNVMVGQDGRVCVMDFGLARPVGESFEDTDLHRVREELSPGPSQDGATEGAALGSSSGSLSGASVTDLTQTGQILGTPAYMAPEQHEGRDIDARSDQFSFCVAMYEALYGERPFGGETLGVLTFNVLNNRVREPPRGADVPGWIRRELLRGLATDPASRHPSMDALVDALGRDPARGRRTALVVGLGVFAAVAAGLGLAALRTEASLCAGSEAKLAGVWDEGRRQQIKEAILATSAFNAADTWQRLEPLLDEYAQQIVAARVDACEDTRVRQVLSAEVMDRRVRCLDDRQRALAALGLELSHADAAAVQRAIKAVAELPRIESCADLDYLNATVRPPEDPKVAVQVEQLAGTIERAVAARAAGHADASLAILDEIREQSMATGYDPLLAAEGLARGRALSDLARYEEAAAELELAYETALGGGDATRATQTAIQLIAHHGVRLANWDRGEQWARQALAELRRDGQLETPLHAEALSRLCATELLRGDYSRATELAQRSLEIRLATLGERHIDVADSYNNLGMAAFASGDYEGSRIWHEKALALREEALGPTHGDVASSLNNLATTYHQRMRWNDADIYYRRAIDVLVKARGEDHPDVATVRNNHGAVLSSLGDFDGAKLEHERALKIRHAALGPNHPDTLASREDLAILAQRADRIDEAIELERSVLLARAEALGADHPDTLRAVVNLGSMLLDREAPQEAKVLLADGYARAQTVLGADHPEVVRAQGMLLVALQSLRELDEAEPIARDLLARIRALPDSDLVDAEVIEVVLAEVLLESGETTVALELLGRPPRPEAHPRDLAIFSVSKRLRLALALAKLDRPDEARVEAHVAFTEIAALESVDDRNRRSLDKSLVALAADPTLSADLKSARSALAKVPALKGRH